MLGDLWSYVPDIPTDTRIFVHMAALFYVAGFLVRDQLYLRLLILCGTCCYMIYYFFLQDTPLWEAFIWSAIMGTANSYIIILLILERTTFSMSDDEKELYKAFSMLTPGEFRKVLKRATWKKTDQPVKLTRNGVMPERLYYIMDGRVVVKKKKSTFDIARPGFIGEIAYTLNCPATADVGLSSGGHYAWWAREDLKKLEMKYPGIRVGLHSILGADMAGKVAASVGESTIT